MTDDRAQALVDLAVVSLGVVAAIYVMKTPPLRRIVGRALKYGLFTAAPSLLWQEVAHAWAETQTKNPESRIENQE